MVRFLLQIWQTRATFVFVRLCTCSFGDLIFFQPGICQCDPEQYVVRPVVGAAAAAAGSGHEPRTPNIGHICISKSQPFFLNACLSCLCVFETWCFFKDYFVCVTRQNNDARLVCPCPSWSTGPLFPARSL